MPIKLLWISTKLMTFGSLALMIGAVIVFGRALMNEAADGKGRRESVTSWRHPDTALALKLFVAGLLFLALSILLANVMPGRG